DVQRLLAGGRIQSGHARALLSLPDDGARSALALRVAAEGLSVRQVEDLVKKYGDPRPRILRLPAPPDARLAEVEDLLSERFATRVLVMAGRRKGRIVVEFASREDLERIVAGMVVPGPDAQPGSGER